MLLLFRAQESDTDAVPPTAEPTKRRACQRSTGTLATREGNQGQAQAPCFHTITTEKKLNCPGASPSRRGFSIVQSCDVDRRLREIALTL